MQSHPSNRFSKYGVDNLLLQVTSTATSSQMERPPIGDSGDIRQ